MVGVENVETLQAWKNTRGVAGGRGFADLSPCVSVIQTRTTQLLCASVSSRAQRNALCAPTAMMMSACSPEGSGIAGWHSPFARLTTTLSDDRVANPYPLLAPGVMKPVSKSPAARILIVA